jgi:NodT family efflux transporter outer membrane factor (OMF) lipoprotein
MKLRLTLLTAVATLMSAAAHAEDWWRAWPDQQLVALIDEATSRSPNHRVVLARVEKARAAAGAARAALLPALTANGTVAESKQSYNTGIPPQFVPHGFNSFGEVTLNLNYEFDLWGKNRKALAAAVGETRAAEMDVAEARLQLSTAVAGAYVDLIRLRAERDVALRALASRQETLDLVSGRVANGLDTQGELNEAKAGVPQARADLKAVEEAMAETRHELADLLGAGPERGDAIDPPAAFAMPDIPEPKDLRLHLIGRRPDIIAARLRTEAAAKRVGAAKAAFLPDVNLAALGGYEALFLRQLFAGGSSLAQAGPAVSLPIFEGGRLRAALHGAKADYAEATATYEATVNLALHQTADALSARSAQAARLTETTAALEAQERAYDIARARYRGGLAGYLSVLTVEDKVLALRRARVDLEAEGLTLEVALIRALGGGLDTTSSEKGA